MDTMMLPCPDEGNRKAELPEQSKSTPTSTIKSHEIVSAAGIPLLLPFAPLPLFSLSLALHALLWTDQTETQHCAGPGLFTELFWHELKKDEMPIRLTSIFATAKSAALGFTDIQSFEISSLQHLSSFKHALPEHEIIIERATPLCPSLHLPAQAAYQQPCLCPYRFDLDLPSALDENSFSPKHPGSARAAAGSHDKAPETDLKPRKLSQHHFFGIWRASFFTAQWSRTSTKSTLKKQKSGCVPLPSAPAGPGPHCAIN